MVRTAAEQSPVKIHVRTTINQGKQQETYELTTFGRFYKKNDKYYLIYEEQLEVGKVKSSVKFATDEAVIIRSGAINMRLAFQTNRLMKGHYETEYGLLDTLTDSKGLEFEQQSATQGKLSLLYDLIIQEELAGTYQMEIMYQEEA